MLYTEEKVVGITENKIDAHEKTPKLTFLFCSCCATHPQTIRMNVFGRLDIFIQHQIFPGNPWYVYYRENRKLSCGYIFLRIYTRESQSSFRLQSRIIPATQPRMYINRTSRDERCVSTITILEGEDSVVLFLVVRLIRFYIFHLTNLAPSSIVFIYPLVYKKNQHVWIVQHHKKK